MFHKALIPFTILLALSLVCAVFADNLDKPIGAAFSPTTYKWAYTNNQPPKNPRPVYRPYMEWGLWDDLDLGRGAFYVTWDDIQPDHTDIPLTTNDVPSGTREVLDELKAQFDSSPNKVYIVFEAKSDWATTSEIEHGGPCKSGTCSYGNCNDDYTFLDHYQSAVEWLADYMGDDFVIWGRDPEPGCNTRHFPLNTAADVQMYIDMQKVFYDAVTGKTADAEIVILGHNGHGSNSGQGWEPDGETALLNILANSYDNGYKFDIVDTHLYESYTTMKERIEYWVNAIDDLSPACDATVSVSAVGGPDPAAFAEWDKYKIFDPHDFNDVEGTYPADYGKINSYQLWAFAMAGLPGYSIESTWDCLNHERDYGDYDTGDYACLHTPKCFVEERVDFNFAGCSSTLDGYHTDMHNHNVVQMNTVCLAAGAEWCLWSYFMSPGLTHLRFSKMRLVNGNDWKKAKEDANGDSDIYDTFDWFAGKVNACTAVTELSGDISNTSNDGLLFKYSISPQNVYVAWREMDEYAGASKTAETCTISLDSENWSSVKVTNIENTSSSPTIYNLNGNHDFDVSLKDSPIIIEKNS